MPLLVVHTNEWCPRPELNQRRMDFQSIALPTELQGHSEGKSGGYASGGQILPKHDPTCLPWLSTVAEGFALDDGQGVSSDLKETGDSSRIGAMSIDEIEAEA